MTSISAVSGPSRIYSSAMAEARIATAIATRAVIHAHIGIAIFPCVKSTANRSMKGNRQIPRSDNMNKTRRIVCAPIDTDAWKPPAVSVNSTCLSERSSVTVRISGMSCGSCGRFLTIWNSWATPILKPLASAISRSYQPPP